MRSGSSALVLIGPDELELDLGDRFSREIGYERIVLQIPCDEVSGKQLLPDISVNEILANNVSNYPSFRNLVITGHPRTADQASFITKFLRSRDHRATFIVINIEDEKYRQKIRPVEDFLQRQIPSKFRVIDGSRPKAEILRIVLTTINEHNMTQ